MRNFSILLLLFFTALESSADVKKGCMTLLAPPSAEEADATTEGRVQLYYSKLLDQYQMSMSEEGFLKFAREALETERFYALQVQSASQQHLKEALEGIGELVRRGETASGQRIDPELVAIKLRDELASRIGKIIETATVLKNSVQETEEIQLDRFITPYALTTGKGDDLFVHAESGRILTKDPNQAQNLIFSDVRTGQPIQVLKSIGTEPIRHIHPNSDFTRALTISASGEACLWDLKSGEVIRKMQFDTGTHLRVNPEITFAITAGISNKNLSYWNLETGEKTLSLDPSLKGSSVLKGHKIGVRDLTVSSDFTKVVSVGDSPNGGELIVWDLKPKGWFDFKKSRITLQVEEPFFSPTLVKTNREMTQAVAAGEHDIYFYDLKTGKITNKLRVKERVGQITVDPEYTRLAVTISHPLDPTHMGSILVYDLKSSVHAKTHQLTSPHAMTTVNRITEDARFGFMVSFNDNKKSLIIWDLETGAVLRHGPVKVGPFGSVKVNEDFTQAIVTYRDQVYSINLTEMGQL